VGTMFTQLSSGAVFRRDGPDRPGIGFSYGTTHFGLHLDFLIDPDRTVVTLHYGRCADGQRSVDQLLDIHRSFSRKESL
jgi:hypothetical protein